MNPALAECIPFLLCALAFAIGVVALAHRHDLQVRAAQDRLDAELTTWIATCRCDDCERERARFPRAA